MDLSVSRFKLKAALLLCLLCSAEMGTLEIKPAYLTSRKR